MGLTADLSGARRWLAWGVWSGSGGSLAGGQPAQGPLQRLATGWRKVPTAQSSPSGSRTCSRWPCPLRRVGSAGLG